MTVTRATCLTAILLAQASCQRPSPVQTGEIPVSRTRQSSFQEQARLLFVNPRQGSAEIYERRLLRLKSRPQRARIIVDTTSQTAKLYDGHLLVIKTPVSTGKRGFETPTGSFKILEKIENKESTLYGSVVDSDTGAIVQKGVDRRDIAPLEGDLDWDGANMPFWGRLTWTGIGLHVGKIPGNPASHGCIRVPREVMPLIYAAIVKGTKVTVK